MVVFLSFRASLGKPAFVNGVGADPHLIFLL
jgi:hypothetical protein